MTKITLVRRPYNFGTVCVVFMVFFIAFLHFAAPDVPPELKFKAYFSNVFACIALVYVIGKAILSFKLPKSVTIDFKLEEINFSSGEEFYFKEVEQFILENRFGFLSLKIKSNQRQVSLENFYTYSFDEEDHLKREFNNYKSFTYVERNKF
ncbi:hypothetical protein [Idiomarina aquatica]|nr:hypothetical protein [Idiomarina aquatica]